MSPRPFAPGTIEAHKRPLLRFGDKCRTLAEYIAAFGLFYFAIDWLPAHWERFAAFWGIK